MGRVDDVYDHLVSQSLVNDGTWTGKKRALTDRDPDQVVVIGEDGGPSPETQRDNGIGDSAQGSGAVQVLVRGAPWGGSAGFTRAQAILDDLHGRNGDTIGSTVYFKARARTMEPVFVGFDDSHRSQHTVSIILTEEL